MTLTTGLPLWKPGIEITPILIATNRTYYSRPVGSYCQSLPATPPRCFHGASQLAPGTPSLFPPGDGGLAPGINPLSGTQRAVQCLPDIPVFDLRRRIRTS